MSLRAAANPVVASTSTSIDAFKKLHAAEYQKRFIEQNVRADGRTLNEFRATTVTCDSLANCVGSALAKIGATSVLAGVTAEIGAAPDSASESTVVANIELLPICSSRFTFGRPSQTAQCLNAFLNQILRGSGSGGGVAQRANLVDQTSLSLAHLLPARKLLPVDNDDERSTDEPQYADAEDDAPPMSWYLRVDLYCLDHDGNLNDAALLAMLAALRNVRLPTLTRTTRGEYERLPSDATPPTPLRLACAPVAASVVVIGDGFVVGDPNLDEEAAATTSLTVVVDEHERVLALRMSGSAAQRVDMLSNCIALARARRRVVDDALLAAGSRQ